MHFQDTSILDHAYLRALSQNTLSNIQYYFVYFQQSTRRHALTYTCTMATLQPDSNVISKKKMLHDAMHEAFKNVILNLCLSLSLGINVLSLPLDWSVLRTPNVYILGLPRGWMERFHGNWICDNPCTTAVLILKDILTLQVKWFEILAW